MSETFDTPSGIAVVCDGRDEAWIRDELRRLDPDLFLTKEVHKVTRAPVYAVYHYKGPNAAPIHVLYWTDDGKSNGPPRPLSSGLVYEVQSRKRFWGRNLAAEAIDANEAMQEAAAAEHDAEMEEEVVRYHRRRLRMGSGQNVKRFFTSRASS